jgi:hypothetical protein
MTGVDGNQVDILIRVRMKRDLNEGMRLSRPIERAQFFNFLLANDLNGEMIFGFLSGAFIS